MRCTLMKRWVTGGRAEMDQEDIDNELFQLAREWMEGFKLRKHPGHVAEDTDTSLWKEFSDFSKEEEAVRVLLFRRSLHHRC